MQKYFQEQLQIFARITHNEVFLLLIYIRYAHHVWFLKNLFWLKHCLVVFKTILFSSQEGFRPVFQHGEEFQLSFGYWEDNRLFEELN